MTHWQVTRLHKSLGEHAPAWDALNQKSFDGHPLLDSRFVDGLLQHFGDGSERLCVLTRDGQPEAMCILVPKGFGLWRSFLPSQAQISPMLVPDFDVIKSLIRSLPGFVGTLELLCADPHVSHWLYDSLNTASWMDHALTMDINLEGGFENYWRTRSKNLTKNVGRYERRVISDNIAPRFSCITDPEQIGGAVARYADLESKGWKATAGTALSGNNTQTVFYTELLRRFGESASAMVFELWFDDHLVASRLIIIGNRMVIILKTTFDESHRKYAPGRLLLRRVIEALFARHPDKVLEFYTDAGLDQLTWATGKRWITHWTVHRNLAVATVFNLVRTARHAIKGVRGSNLEPGETDSVEVFQHTDQLAPDVLALFDETEADNLKLGARWYQNLIDTVYPSHGGVHIYVLRRNGQAIAALPILATKGKLGWTIESLGNYYTSLYAPAMASYSKYRDIALLIRAASQAHAPTIAFRFSPMDPESGAYRRLWNALSANGIVAFGFFCFGNWYLPVVGDGADYLHNREGQLRNTIKRHRKKFQAAGGRFEIITSGDDLARGLAAYEQVYASSWKHAEPYPEFIPGLARICADNGALRLGIAWLNDKAVAAQLWVVANGTANIYKLAYDESYKTYAPGTLLTAALMEYAIDKDQPREIDYLIGDDAYKKDWMSHRRERWGIIAYNPRTFGGILGLCKEAVGRLLKPAQVRLRGIASNNKVHH